MNQNKITQKVYEGAIGTFRQRIPQEAQEEAQERIAGQQAERNAQLAQYLIGNNMLAFQDFLISGLSLRSRPEAVYVGGLLQSQAGDRQRGADAPQPATLAVPDPGLTADVHLTSVLNSIADGLFQRGQVKSVSNLMIVTKDVPPGSPPQQAATIAKNVGFPAYSRAVDEALKANNPKVTAIRVKRPAQAPEFAVDARGFLVATVLDVELEVPAPDKSTQAGSVIGVPARILRLQIPHLEVAFSYQVEEPTPGSHRIRAKVEDFSPSRPLPGPGDQRRRVEGVAADPVQRSAGHQRHRRPAAQPADRGQSGQPESSRLCHPVDLPAGSLGLGAGEPGASPDRRTGGNGCRTGPGRRRAGPDQSRCRGDGSRCQRPCCAATPVAVVQ